MRDRTLHLTLIVLSCSLFVSTSNGQEKLDPTAVDPAAMEKMMCEFAKLAPEHERFKQMEGSWTTESKTYYPNPAEPTITKGTSHFKRVLGGRYLVQQFTGAFAGDKFEGLGLIAFDKVKKKYVGVWADSMNTGLMRTEGSFDAATNTMTETGSADSPMGRVHMKMVTKHLDDDTFTFTMFSKMPDGSETKDMEIVYRRAE